jgi:hypothetical protein
LPFFQKLGKRLGGQLPRNLHNSVDRQEFVQSPAEVSDNEYNQAPEYQRHSVQLGKILFGNLKVTG